MKPYMCNTAASADTTWYEGGDLDDLLLTKTAFSSTRAVPLYFN